MNWDQIQGNWKQLTGKVQQQWGKLTDDDMTRIKAMSASLPVKFKSATELRKKRRNARLKTGRAACNKSCNTWRSLRLAGTPPFAARRARKN